MTEIALTDLTVRWTNLINACRNWLHETKRIQKALAYINGEEVFRSVRNGKAKSIYENAQTLANSSFLPRDYKINSNIDDVVSVVEKKYAKKIPPKHLNTAISSAKTIKTDSQCLDVLIDAYRTLNLDKIADDIQRLQTHLYETACRLEEAASQLQKK